MTISSAIGPCLLPALCLMLVGCTQTDARQTGGGTGRSDVQASAPGGAVCHTASTTETARGVAATNQARVGAGLPPVRASAQLSQAAARHACDMARRGRMTHQGSSSSGPAQRIKSTGYRPTVTAENIAAGPYGIDRVLSEWAASSGHAANILIPQVSAFGIGHATGSDGRTQYWVAIYAAPAGR